jgi:dienelactone hydrolase
VRVPGISRTFGATASHARAIWTAVASWAAAMSLTSRLVLIESRCARGKPKGQNGTNAMFRAAHSSNCLNAYHWLVSDGDVDPRTLVVLGDSAGGNLAVAITAAARDQGQRDVSSPQAVRAIWSEARKAVRAEAPTRRERATKAAKKAR